MGSTEDDTLDLLQFQGGLRPSGGEATFIRLNDGSNFIIERKMEMTNRIISVEPQGEATYTDKALLQELIEAEKQLIGRLNDPTERRRSLLHLALQCEEYGLECDAVDLFSNVLWGVTCLDKHSEDYAFCRQAYDGLSRLWNSADEYVWETASQVLSEARELFEN